MLARDRPSRYGVEDVPFIVGRGPVPRHAAVYRNLARDRPSRYGMGKVIGPSNAREGQALALREGDEMTRRQLITKKRVPGRKKAWDLTQSMLASQAEMHTQRE